MNTPDIAAIRRALGVPEPADLLTVAEAADIARVHTATIRRWIAAGLPALRPGGRIVRIRRTDLDKWVRAPAWGPKA